MVEPTEADTAAPGVQVSLRVRWADMDAFGHVNNAVYLNYLEEARDRVLEELFGAESYDFVLARVAIDYRQEITQAAGEVTVESRVTGWGRSSVRTAETIRFRDGTLSAEAAAVVVARDPATGSSRPLTDDEVARLSARWLPATG